MLARFLFGNQRILLLLIGMILVAGLNAFNQLPRLEDPVLGKRVGVVSTIYPGANAEQVEQQITRLVEQELQDIAEIDTVRSTSRSGISNVVIELRDEVTDVEKAWFLVRDRVERVKSKLPERAVAPEFERFELKAYAVILALRWEDDEPIDLVALRRLGQQLRDRIDTISGTQKVDVFGDPGEEIKIEVPTHVLAATGLSTASLAAQVKESMAQQPAGQVAQGGIELAVDLGRSASAVDKLRDVRVQLPRDGSTVALEQLGEIRAGQAGHSMGTAFIEGKPAIVLGAFVRDEERIDIWASKLEQTIDSFQEGLPVGVRLDVIFSQDQFVAARMNQLAMNLAMGTLAVALVVLLMMGLRNAIVVTATLPLSAFLVLTGMQWLEIPVHQMSVTGLVIALGLLIDNAIVMVDEIRQRRMAGKTRSESIVESIRLLGMPLFGSTITTTLAFLPIALLPGPPGEFVGTIAVSVILAINASFFLAVSIVPAVAAWLSPESDRESVLSHGFFWPALAGGYRELVGWFLRNPVLALLAAMALPGLGFWKSQELKEQFFPASDRRQIHIEVELPACNAETETAEVMLAIREKLLDEAGVRSVHCFVGGSAPTFYYNVVPRRRGTPFYGQAIIDLNEGGAVQFLVRRLQKQLDQDFPDCRVLVRQLAQGPPVEAPVEIQIRGPDLGVLSLVGSEVRSILSGIPSVTHTRSDLEETVPKLGMVVDPQAARLAGLSINDINAQIYTTLEGADAGAVVDQSISYPVRVLAKEESGMDLLTLASLEIQPSSDRSREPRNLTPGRVENTEAGTPLSAIAKPGLESDVAAVVRVDGMRTNEVKAFTTAGVLPSTVLDEFRIRLQEANLKLPDGYEIRFGGESAERNEAVGKLISNAVVLFVMMVLVLVLSFRSYRVTIIVSMVGGLAVGLGLGALYLFQFPFGFMAIVGTMGLVGVAINDAIVVLAGIRENEAASAGDREAIADVVQSCTRHVLTTSITTVAGFLPLILGGGGFWPPMAIAIAGGVGGATLLALFFAPAAYVLMLGTSSEGWNSDLERQGVPE